MITVIATKPILRAQNPCFSPQKPSTDNRHEHIGGRAGRRGSEGLQSPIVSDEGPQGRANNTAKSLSVLAAGPSRGKEMKVSAAAPEDGSVLCCPKT